MKTLNIASVKAVADLTVSELILHEGHPAIVLETRQKLAHSSVTTVIFPDGETTQAHLKSIQPRSPVASFGTDWILEVSDGMAAHKQVSRTDPLPSIGELVLTREGRLGVVAAHSDVSPTDSDRFHCYLEAGDFEYEEYVPIRISCWKIWTSENARISMHATPLLEHHAISE